MAKDQQKTQKGQASPIFTEDQARAYFESRRWPSGPVCIECGSVAVYRLQGESTRPGLIKCRDCKAQFTVTVGTIMEDSHLSLSKWALAFHLMVSSKKGISALQLQRNLGLGSYKTAWHLAHRIREAMKYEPVVGELKGKVEVDEVFLGPHRKRNAARTNHKKVVVALIERGGQARVPAVANVGGKALKNVVRAYVDKNAMVYTDGYTSYKGLDKEFAGHETVNHSAKEYARGDVHINNCESFFGLLRRGVIGSFHHISAEHAHRYANEFCFRWNNRNLSDTDRRDAVVKNTEGRRLMFKEPIDPAKQLPKF